MLSKKKIGVVALIGLGVIVMASFAIGYGGRGRSPVAVTPSPEPPLLDQINAVRAKAGKPPLVEDARLSLAAKEKAQDMVSRGYRAHHLEGESTFVFLDKYYHGIAGGGENLAWCQQTDSQRVYWWINSPSHYKGMTGDETLWGSATIHSDKDGCDYTVNYFVRPQ